MGMSQVYKFEIFLWIWSKICTNAHALSLGNDNSSVENSWLKRQETVKKKCACYLLRDRTAISTMFLPTQSLTTGGNKLLSFFLKVKTKRKLCLHWMSQNNLWNFSKKKKRWLRWSRIPSLREVWISSISHLILALQFNNFLSQIVKTSFWHAPTSS